jgi:hypothetical protein
LFPTTTIQPKNITTAQNDYFMDCIHSGIAESKRAVTAATSGKHSSSFKLFQKFLSNCNIADPFLDQFTPNQKTLIITGFAYSIRHNHHKSTTKSILTGGTVNAAVSNVVQAFRQNLRPDPTIDSSGQKAAILINQIKAYKNKDPPTKHQACLPMIVWISILKDKSNSLNESMGQLITGALFFAMRSCEYSTTNNQEDKKTKLLCLRNIRLFSISKEGYMITIPHTASLTELQSAECVSITFENQKNGEKDACITQHRTANDKILCPVRSWALIIKRINQYPKTNENTTVNTFMAKNKLVRITSTQTRNLIRSHVQSIGPHRLGVDVKTVGTHSLRSSCAMLLYLSNVRTSTIMLVGRWKSDAFLLYLRRQVKEFTAGVSQQMVAQPDMFFSIPSEPMDDLPSSQKAEWDDPMTSNINSIASSSRFNGLSSNNNTTKIHTPAFHVWN